MNLLKSLTTVSAMTILSRIFGFLRDITIARIFGVGLTTDAFFVAFKLPNFLRRIFAEGAFSQSFLPILSEYKSQKKENDIREFVACIAGLLTLLLSIVTIVGILAAPQIIMITAPGFSDIPQKFLLTSKLLRITFSYILLISLTSLIGAILNTWNQFLVPAFSPVLLNISMIFFSIFATPLFDPPAMALAWGVIVGGILQLTYQLPYLKKIGMLVLPRLQFHNAGVWRVIRLIWPSILGISISQVSLIINTTISSFLVSGSVSWMYYADRLMEFPSAVLGVALGTILLPELSRNFSIKNYDEHSRLIDWGLRLCFLLALPSSIALVVLSKPIIVTLFQYGKFSSFDSEMTQHALISYSIGLTGLILVKVLVAGFYSRQDIKTPLCIAIITFIFTQLMNLIFIGPLKHAGLSLSISLGACFNAALLYWQLRKKKFFQPKPGWCILLLRLISSMLIMALVSIMLLKIMPDWDKGNMFWRLIRLFSVITGSIFTYCITLWVIGCRPKHLSSL